MVLWVCLTNEAVPPTEVFNHGGCNLETDKWISIIQTKNRRFRSPGNTVFHTVCHEGPPKMVTGNQEHKAMQLLLAGPLEDPVILPDQRLHYIT
jgi:hypothetical protein